jgi:hypothetical protein
MKKDFLLREAFQFLFELGPFDSAPSIFCEPGPFNFAFNFPAPSSR